MKFFVREESTYKSTVEIHLTLIDRSMLQAADFQKAMSRPDIGPTSHPAYFIFV